MRDNFGIFYFGFVLGAIATGALISWISSDAPIASNRPIAPELTITIKDGVADTVWVYRKPVEK